MTDPTLANLPSMVIGGFFKELLKFWWFFILILIIVVLIIVIERKIKDRKYSSINEIQSDRRLIYQLRALKPQEFEDYIAHLFNKLGFTTETVGGSHDGGVDVIATKEGIKHYIQCKKHITSQVSLGDVRGFYGSLVDHLANGKGYFITTNKFTLEAERFAEDKSIELIDGLRLLEYIKMAGGETSVITPKQAGAQICPQCGGSLLARDGRHGAFWGCSNFPECKFTKNK